MAENKSVANPPAGGPQDQASTNDDNQNTVLQTEPWLVTVAAHGQAGVVSRFTSEADANTHAAARRETLPDYAEVSVRKEADLPALVQEVEEAAFAPASTSEDSDSSSSSSSSSLSRARSSAAKGSK